MAQIETGIVFFDGVCNLCNGAVQFILRCEKNPGLKFAALQGNTFRNLAQKPSGPLPETILFLYEGILYSESEAVMRISRCLKQPWRFLGSLGSLLPEFLRNALYRFIAKNRYRWFGKKEACYLPTPELKKRFLD